jgi:hypothetical protein
VDSTLTATSPPTKNARVRAALEKACQALVTAHERIVLARDRDPGLCSGFGLYSGVKPSLDAASALLARRTYRVALAGMMSAGKSTLANALLRRPGLLPTGIEETTLTITIVSRGRRGDGEGLVVHYLTYEEALRGIFERGHFQKHFPAAVLQKARDGTPPEVLRAEVAHLAAQGELPDDVREQLTGFLEALDSRRAQLGTTIRPPLDDRRLYLAPRTHRDVGHLLLIAKAELHVETDLLEDEGIELVDLPGTDSTNERQQRIAYEYLADTDLLLAVPNAAGFRFVDIDVLARFRQARGDIRDRVFFVLNRFDEAKVADLETVDTALAYFRKLVDMLNRDYDPGNLFFTCGLWSMLEERRRSGSSLEDERELRRLEQATTDLVAHLERLGVPSTIEAEWDERWAGRLAASIRACARTGGVDRLRSSLGAYLKNELELQRLREVRGHLESAARAIEGLIGPERGRVKGFLDSAREQLKATGGYLEQVAWDTRDALDRAHEELARTEGDVAELPFQLMMRRLSDQFALAIEGLLGQNNGRLDLRQIAREAGNASTQDLMQRVIDQARQVLSQKLVEFLVARLAQDIARRYQEALDPLDNGRVLEEFGRVIDKPDLERRYLGKLNDLERTLGLITRLRALEETWGVSAMDFRPAPGARAFDELEADFRRALMHELQGVYAERMKQLAAVLLKHYRVVLDDFIREFEEITAEALREARLVGARVPVELLAARALPEDRQRYGLAELVSVTDAAAAALDAVVLELGR